MYSRRLPLFVAPAAPGAPPALVEPKVIDAVTTTTTVANTTTRTTVGSLVLPSPAVVPETALRLVAGGRISNNNVTSNWTLELFHGANLLSSSVYQTGTSGNPRWWTSEYDILCPTTASQKIRTFTFVGFQTGVQADALYNTGDLHGYNETALDWSGTVTLDFKITHAVASAAYESDLRSAYVIKYLPV